MALWDEVKNRYPNSSLLVSLTRQDSTSSTTVDDTIGTRAATAAQSWFKRLVNVTFDLTDDDHVTVAVDAVINILKRWSDKYGDTVEAERTRIEEDMKQLSRITARDRIMPKTSSILEPSSEDVEDQVDRPLFDKERFGGITPDSPAAP